MNFQPQPIDVELHPSQLTDPVFRISMTSSVLHPLGPVTQTSAPHPRFTAPILAITGEATSNRFLSSGGSGSTIESLFGPATSNAQPVEPSSDTFISGEEQNVPCGRENFYRGIRDVNHSSIGFHPSQITGPEFRQTSQPLTGFTIPILAALEVTTPIHVLSLYGSGSTTESLSSSTNANAQPVQPSSTLQPIELDDIEVTCLLCGSAFLGFQVRNHLREKHPALVHKSDKLLCPLCTTTPAKEVTNFCRHFQKHHKVVRYKCSGCSYAALERWNVDRHVRKMKCAKD